LNSLSVLMSCEVSVELNFLGEVMRTQVMVLVLTVVSWIGFSPDARADLPIDVANLQNTQIQFTPVAGGANIVFTDSLEGGVTGAWGFNVTSNQLANSGLVGRIDGTYSYQTSDVISPLPGFQEVNITGVGLLVINDALGSGSNLIGTVNGFDLSATLGSGGVLNDLATVNLSGISYTGMNADLRSLMSNADGGSITVTFQFNPSRSLTDLAFTGGETSWSGSITNTAVPEPSTVLLMGLGVLGMLGYNLCYRKDNIPNN
jgi:hypothetical protein